MDEALVPMFFRRVDENSDDSDSSDSLDDELVDANNGEGDRKNRRTCPNVSYDTSLPTQHSYLGTDLEELSGRTVLDDNSCQSIPLLTLPGVVLIPGQILPLQLFHPATVSMMMHIINSDRTFGMINSRFSGRTFGNRLDPIGTTAEIRSYREEGDEPFGLITLRIKAEGRQRFEVLETRRQPDGMLIGKVRILPEIVLGDPGEGARLKCLDRFRVSPPRKVDSDSVKQSVPASTSKHKYRSEQQYLKYNFANLTWFPSFVYKLYDPQVIMENIKAKLKGWNDSLKTEYMPSDPTEFSYWVAANLPLDDNQRLDLLRVNDVVQRLRRELKILEECSLLRCRDCHSLIANRNDIFSMSLKGPQGTYVNPDGYVHEAITLYRAKGLMLIGRPSVEQSWFPGYAWTIAECELCKCHMGWKFTAVNKTLQPTKFWALCRSSLQADLTGGNVDFRPEGI